MTSPTNAHIHLPPNFSAFQSVAQAVDLAAEQGLSLLGASNYYDHSVYHDFAARAQSRGIFPLFGIEIICLLDDLQSAGVRINDPANPGKMYLCGKGISRFSPYTPRGGEIMKRIRLADGARMAAMADALEARFAAAGVSLGLSEPTVKQMIADRHGSPMETIHIQERHLCQAAQQRLFERIGVAERQAKLSAIYNAPAKSAPDGAIAIQNEIRSQLLKSGKPAYRPETFIGFDRAMELIAELGGLPCYPVLADGVSPVCEFESTPDSLVTSLKDRRILAAEFIPNRNTPDVLARYVTALRSAGLVVTAGTEHNTLDLIPLAPACVANAPIPADIADIFREGAGVAAAHQNAMMNDRPGFDGHDIPAWADRGRKLIEATRRIPQ